MLSWQRFPFVRFTMLLILGILLYEYAPFLWEYCIWVIVLSFLVLLGYLFFGKSDTGYNKLVLGLFSSMIFVGFGVWLSGSSDVENHEDHMNHQPEPVAFIATVANKEIPQKKNPK